MIHDETSPIRNTHKRPPMWSKDEAWKVNDSNDVIESLHQEKKGAILFAQIIMIIWANGGKIYRELIRIMKEQDAPWGKATGENLFSCWQNTSESFYVGSTTVECSLFLCGGFFEKWEKETVTRLQLPVISCYHHIMDDIIKRKAFKINF